MALGVHMKMQHLSGDEHDGGKFDTTCRLAFL
jgi:hypothetical protein